MIAMPSPLRLVTRMMRRRLAPCPTSSESPPEVREAPLRFGEILAASTIADFAILPLECWPGYRVTTAQAEDDNGSAAQPREVNRKD